MGAGHWLVGRSFSNVRNENGTPDDFGDDYHLVSFVDPGTESVYHTKMRRGFSPGIWYKGAWVEFDIMVSVSPTDIPTNETTAQYFVAQNEIFGRRGSGVLTGDFTFTLLGDPNTGGARTSELTGDPSGRLYLARLTVRSRNPGTATINFFNPYGSGETIRLVTIDAQGNPGLIPNVAFNSPAATITVLGAAATLEAKVILQGGQRPNPGGWQGDPPYNPVPITLRFFRPGADVNNPLAAEFSRVCGPLTKVVGEPFGTCVVDNVPEDTWHITATGPHTLTNLKLDVEITEGLNQVDMNAVCKDDIDPSKRVFGLCEGDVNESGGIFINDIGLLVSSFFKGCDDPGYNPNADLDNNCFVAIADIGLLVGNFFKTSPLPVP